MKNNNLFLKIVQFLLVGSFIFWLGSYISRHLVVYQLFEPEGLVLRSVYDVENLKTVWITISPLIVSNIIAFPIFVVLYAIYLIVSKDSLKKEGWLFISTLIILVTAPFEIFLLLKDYKIISLIYSSVIDSNKVLELVRERITIVINKLSSLQRKIITLTSALKELGVNEIYLPPKLREVIEEISETS